MKLPSLDWLNYGNIYTGSIGTDPVTGCLEKTTFSYRLWKDNTEKGQILKLSYHLTPPWTSHDSKGETTTVEYEFSESGLLSISAFLDEESAKLG